MKKIFTLLALMAMFVGVTSAQQRTLTMQNGGTMYNVAGSSTTGLGTKWVFSGTPEVTITGKKTGNSANIMNRGNTYFIADPVSDFNIALPDGYIIKSFSLVNIKNDDDSAKGTVNFICGAQQQALTSTAQTITVSNVNAQTVDFTLSGPSDKSWLRCPIQKITIDYQPLHIIYNCYDENDAFLERVTSTELYKNETTVDVSGFTHNILGYVQQSITPTSVTINGADAEVKVVYAASSFDYDVTITGNVPDGTTFSVKGNAVTNGANVSYGTAVTESDVVVTFPVGYEYMEAEVVISGSTITINCNDTRWPINFPKSQTFTRGDRHIKSVTFTSASNTETIDGLYTDQSTLCYQDLTASKTVTFPTSTSIKPSFSMAGAWQHGFVYIDLNNDGDFTDKGELVAKINQDNPNLSTDIPEFTSPTSVGTYRMRLKTDWSSEDPGGNPDPSNYIIDNGGMIVDITLSVPSVAVTYVLQVGGETVNTVVEENVTGGSAVNVPASLTENYSPLAYDFATSGTIGNTNSTITVTATPKTGVVTSLSSLSNSKAYTLTTERGALYIKSDHLASNGYANDGATAGEFALINVANDYYLYSIDAGQFVLKDGTLSSTVTHDVVALTMTEQTVKPLYLFKFGSNGLNINDTSDDYELVINSHVTPDAGNMYYITEAGSVDVSAAETAIESYIQAQTTTYNNIIAALKAVNWGLTSAGNHGKVGYYNFTSNASGEIYAYSGNEMAFFEMLETEGYSAERLQVVQSLTVPGAYALNMPATNKFYRFHIGNDYMCNVAGSDNVRTVTTTNNDKSTIFYLDNNSYLVAYADGYGFNYGYCKPTATGIFNSFDFSESTTAGYYTIHSNAGTETNQWSDRYLTIDGNNSKLAEGQGAWTIEEVTSLPVTISSVGYATLYAPVALTIPTGVTAYIATIENTSYLHLEEVEGGIIPANTGVILAGDEGSYDFVITTGGNVDSNVLTGTAVAIARPTDSYILATGSNGIGFYGDGADVIPGFKAYLPAGYSSARGFLGFSFGEVTAITAIEAALNSGKAVYDLNGRRVENPSNGVYIVNGKKIIINKK